MKAAKEELINFLEEVLAPAESNQHATAADFRSMVHTEVHLADEITWAILPYVPLQYES